MNLAFVVTIASSPYFLLVLAKSKTQIYWTNHLDKQIMFSLVKKKKDLWTIKIQKHMWTSDETVLVFI